MSMRHLVKLEVFRSSVTGTWVRTLATFTAGEAAAGRMGMAAEVRAGEEAEARAAAVSDMVRWDR